jgi:hypothetical protein
MKGGHDAMALSSMYCEIRGMGNEARPLPFSIVSSRKCRDAQE